MRFLSVSILLTASAVEATRSTKRGLVFTPNAQWPQDNTIWTQSGSDLTWYYHYNSTPTSTFTTTSQASFEFVPMLWGYVSDTSFADAVKSQIQKGTNITRVMTFNEPDGSSAYGGSEIQPSMAAKAWVKNIIPLQSLGVKVGLPACTGATTAIPWLNQFLANCSQLISTSDTPKNCTYDFVPIHWYGNFEGLASHMGQYSAAFPNATQWITEYALTNADLSTTQTFFNTSAEYFDRLAYVERYSYFGAFRSQVSNIGANAAMLNDDGELTDIGSWYLGGGATGVLPTSSTSNSGKSNAGRFSSPPAAIILLGVTISIALLSI